MNWVVFTRNDDGVVRGNGEEFGWEDRSVSGEETFDAVTEARDDGFVTFRVEPVPVHDGFRFGNSEHSRFGVTRLRENRTLSALE